MHLTCDCTFESSVKYHVISANVTFSTASNGICLLFLGLGYFDGANGSLRLLLRLKMVLNIFNGNSCLRELSLWCHHNVF